MYHVTHAPFASARILLQVFCITSALSPKFLHLKFALVVRGSNEEIVFEAAVYIAGPAEELRSIAASLQEDGVFARELDTLGLAFHSPALDPLLPELSKGELIIQATGSPILGFPRIPAGICSDMSISAVQEMLPNVIDCHLLMIPRAHFGNFLTLYSTTKLKASPEFQK